MFSGIGVAELVMLGVIAVLLFGKRLPEVARNIGRGYGEMRKGLTELQSSINTQIDEPSSIHNNHSANIESSSDFDDFDEPTAPRLQPPSYEDDEGT